MKKTWDMFVSGKVEGSAKSDWWLPSAGELHATKLGILKLLEW